LSGWFSIVVALIRISSFIVTRISINEGMRLQLAKEMLELEGKIQKTKDIVKEVDQKAEEAVDAELRK
jgi:hypothetical protein